MSFLITEGFGDPSAGPSSFVVNSVVASADNTIAITLSDDAVLSGPGLDPAQYVVSVITSGAVPVAVTAIAVAGPVITLTTTIQTNGATYRLQIPSVGIISTIEIKLGGPFTNNFTGFSTAPAVSMVRSTDARHIDVIFSRAMNNAEAEDPNNYGTTPSLTIQSVTKNTDLYYTLTTSHQTTGQSYTLTASNIHDLGGNSI